MGLGFPRDVCLEAYLGRWVEVTALPVGQGLRQEEDIRIDWGMPNEQTRVIAPPSTAEAAVNNVGGHWTPGNPVSQCFDYLQGRNAPTRLSLRVQRDSFTGRTSAFSWDVADSGELWQSATSGSGTVSVGSGVGTHTQPNAAAWILSYVTEDLTDAQTAVTGLWNYNVAGGAIEPANLVLRYQPSGPFAGEHYLLRASVSPAEVLTVAIFHSTLGLISSSTVTVATLTPGANAWRAKFQAEGQTLRGKVYPVGPVGDVDQFEPLDWQVTAHHDRLVSGYPGIRTGVAAGNSNIPVAVSYDDWVLKLMLHAGELAGLQPSWDVTHRFKIAKLKMADVTQRLGKPNRPALSSAARRYLASNSEFTTSDFWPLDESAVAPRQGQSAVVGGDVARFERQTAVVPNRGAITWGVTDRVLTCVPGFAALNNDASLFMATQQVTLGTSWSVMWAMRLSPDAGGRVFLSTAAVSNRFVIVFYTDGSYELFTNPSGVSLATGQLYPAGVDGRWVTFGLTTFNNGGANVGYHINQDGATLGVGNTVGDGAHSVLSQIQLNVPQPGSGGQGDTCFSSVFVTNTRFDAAAGPISVGAKASNVLKGWIGERALARAFRLTAEEGLPFDYWGNLGDTRPMGPQRPIPLMDQLVECAEADGALLYGSRYTAGVTMRGRRSMTGRPPDVTVSYSGGMVAPPFPPAADDRPTANLVRAERTDGGFLIVEQTTGPMNTQNPGTTADAVGRTPADAKGNVESDAQLGDLGGWVRALGTVPEIRYPRMTANLRASQLNTAPGLVVQKGLLGLHPGDRLLMTGLTAPDIHRDIDQLVRGGSMTISDVTRHSLSVNTSPWEKYRSGTWGDSASRYDGAVTTLDAQLTSGTTGARNVTTSAGPVWTVDAGAFPMTVMIGGELVTISGITGAGAAQVMTISARNVNNLPVVGGKTHPAGTRVSLYQPVYYA